MADDYYEIGCPFCGSNFTNYIPDNGFSTASCPKCRHDLISTRSPRIMSFWATDLAVIGHVFRGSNFETACQFASAPDDYKSGARGRLMKEGSETQIDDEVLLALKQLWPTVH